MLFQNLGSKKVMADFSGGQLSSDGGALLLQQVDSGLGISRKLASCFSDRRKDQRVEHSVEALVRQRLFALALGYEDLNDHEHLRRDPLLAAVIGKEDPLGQERRLAKDRGFACASPATLNRLELGARFSDRYRKITADPQKIEAAVLELGVRCLPKDGEVFVLDLDATDDPLHGRQEGAFFHGYYGNHCYLPLFGFVGDIPLWAQLRTSDQDASAGTCEALEKIVPAIRKRFPKARIVVRADSGFSRESILAWCEAQEEVYYLIGMARNTRLEEMVAPALQRAMERHCMSGVACREFVEREYSTLESWSRSRRMLCKAEVLAGMKANPRFVTTNIPAQGILDAEGKVLVSGAVDELYEKVYCARGNAENRIKQMVLDLKSDRTSSSWMASNQMRLWFSSLAYLLLERVRQIGLEGTAWAKATLGTLRLRVLKVAAYVRVSVRRVHVALCSAFPLQGVFRQAARRLAQSGPSLT
jgi:hypothetical protein